MRTLEQLSIKYLAAIAGAVMIAISVSDTAKGCMEAPSISSWLNSVPYLYEASDYIVLARAISSENDKYPSPTTFIPLKTWKGEQEEKLIVSRGLDGPCGLGSNHYLIGNQYLLYLIPEKKKWYWPWGEKYIALHQTDEKSIEKDTTELDRILN